MRRCTRTSFLFSITAILNLAMAVCAVGQSDRGSIAGTILDSSGAVVAGAEITATGAQTGAVYKTTSNSTGAYRLPDLQVGSYTVTATAGGFKTAEQKDVLVQVSSVSALDITLQPGSVQETVSVAANAPTLQTESVDIGNVVSDRQIKDLPLGLSATGQSFLRSAETFVFLAPGTAGPGTNSDAAASGIFESKLSGGQNFATEVILDGVSTQRADSGSAYDQTAPSVEALTEFKVTTSNIPAQYGRTSGGVESFLTKSGGNAFHGTAFDFLRNDKLDANSWTNNFFGAPKPRDHQNDFGGSLGGPVWIPKIYNGRDKTFFFFSWEQYRNNEGTNNVTTVPTDAERSGDFSALLGPGLVDSGGNPIINPCDGTQVRQGQIFDPSTTQTVGGQPCRTAFPGNIIPTRLSTVAQNFLNFVPHANRASDPSCGIVVCNNFLFSSDKPTRDTTMTVRIDENLTEKQKMFFSYSSRDQEVLNGTPILPPPLDPNFFNSNFTHYLRFGHDYVLSSTAVNHFVVGLNRLHNFSKGQSVTGADWDQVLGIGNASGQVFPQFSFSGSPLGIGYQGLSAANDDRNIPNSLVLSDSVAWSKGRHTLQLGFEWRSYQFSRLSQANTSPAYNFSNFQTAYTPNSNISGYPFASFLLGAPFGESLSITSIFPRWNSNYYAGYVQDDYKIRPDLLLNLGLRYSVDTPRHEASGAQSVLDLNAPNPIASGVQGALVYGSDATGANTYYKAFSPRIGFAYAPQRLLGFLHETVVRGAYSVYYSPLQYSDFGQNLTSGTTASPTFNSVDNFSPEQSPDAGFPAFTPPSNAQDPALLNGGNPFFVAPEYGRPGMVQNWSLEIQHQLATDLILSVGYVGMHSTRLHSNLLQINSIAPQFYSLGNDLNLNVTDPNAAPVLSSLGVSVPSWFVPLYGNDATIGQLLRPFPQYRAIDSSTLENVGQSTYNALEAKLERRFRNGLNLLASYTFSKTLTDADSAFPVFTGFNSNVFGAQNAFNLKEEKSVSYQDIPHTFVLSYLYELPAGPGKKYFNHGPASKILGGWQISGYQRYQKGSPVLINAFASSNPYSSGNFRFSRIPGVPLFSPNKSSFQFGAGNSGCSPNPDGTFSANSTNNIFNCAAFLDPNAPDLLAQRGYTFGNLPVFFSDIRSPGYMNEDFAIIKRTALTENQTLTFKLDIPNAFNRHVFGQLDGGISDGTFGVPGGSGRAVLNAPRRMQITLRYEF